MAKAAPITPSYEGSAKALFSKSQWNAALKSAILNAGRNWITNRLPMRFSKYAITDLWYVANKMDRVGISLNRRRIAVIRAMMSQDGTRARIVSEACAEWGGWDPAGKEAAPLPVFSAWLRDQRSQGASWDKDMRSARSAFRRYVLEKSRLNERIDNYAKDNADKYMGGVIPLVHTGQLRDYTTKHARSEAAVKNTQLIIRIPRPGKKYAPVVSSVLRRLGPGEVAQVQADVASFMDSFVAGSAAKGKKGNRKSTQEQVTQQKTIMARERSTVKYRPRKAATHKDRT
jgi:hypothetical protein